MPDYLKTPSFSACNDMVCNLGDWNHWAIFFEDNGSNVTVNSQRYFDMLKAFFITVLRQKHECIQSAIFKRMAAHLTLIKF